MSSYGCAIRTNYFHVKDAAAFKDFMKLVYGGEDSIELLEKQDTNGKPTFMFCCYNGIAGLVTSSDDNDFDTETAYDEFIDGLQKHVADDDAIIIFEAGNEKLRYVVGQAEIITSDSYSFISLKAEAVKRAASVLHNSKWQTQCEG